MKVNINAPEKDKIKNALRNDAVVSALLSKSYAEIDGWVNSNINTLSDVRSLLKRLLKICVFLIRHLKVNIS